MNSAIEERHATLGPFQRGTRRGTPAVAARRRKRSMEECGVGPLSKQQRTWKSTEKYFNDGKMEMEALWKGFLIVTSLPGRQVNLPRRPGGWKETKSQDRDTLGRGVYQSRRGIPLAALGNRTGNHKSAKSSHQYHSVDSSAARTDAHSFLLQIQ